jgi:HAMP domain-containing protein
LRRRELGGHVLLLDVESAWHELTDIVNKLAANLTNQVRNIARLTKAVALGDLSDHIYVDASGEFLDLKNTVNGRVVRCGYSLMRSLVYRSKSNRRVGWAAKYTFLTHRHVEGASADFVHMGERWVNERARAHTF